MLLVEKALTWWAGSVDSIEWYQYYHRPSDLDPFLQVLIRNRSTRG